MCVSMCVYIYTHMYINICICTHTHTNFTILRAGQLFHIPLPELKYLEIVTHKHTRAYLEHTFKKDPKTKLVCVPAHTLVFHNGGH